jgi:hypothetical protein
MDNIIIIVVIIILLLFVSYILYINQYSYQTQDQRNVHKAKAMVITCIDFRLIDDAVRFMNRLGYNNNYDEFIIAGASLGYNKTSPVPFCTEWKKTIDDHIGLSMTLHDIKEIIVIDHMYCGAYKKYYTDTGDSAINNGEFTSEQAEIDKHKENLQIFVTLIQERYPYLGVKAYLMDLHGNINDNETIIQIPSI